MNTFTVGVNIFFQYRVFHILKYVDLQKKYYICIEHNVI